MNRRRTRPRVTLSVATSIDGYIDDKAKRRLLLSNAEDLDRVDQLRAESDGIFVGAGAIRTDDPRLTVRSDQRRADRVTAGLPEHPLKATVTRSGNLASNLRWFHHGDQRVVYTVDSAAVKLSQTLGGLAAVVSLGDEVDFAALLTDLQQRGVSRLMVEGGQQVHTSFLAAGLVDEIHLAVAPILVGDGPRFVGRAQLPWTTTERMELVEATPIGDVVLLRYLIEPPRTGTGDERWLLRAVELAERCPPSDGAFSVGAVVVARDGTVLAEGYSRETDDRIHAEESAMAKIGHDVDLSTATIYSSLEPCGQRKRNPRPCARLIVDRGIGRVVMAWREPTDFVEKPSGYQQLVEAGIEVVELPAIAEPNYR